MKIKYLENGIEATVMVGITKIVITGSNEEVWKKVSELTGIKY